MFSAIGILYVLQVVFFGWVYIETDAPSAKNWFHKVAIPRTDPKYSDPPFTNDHYAVCAHEIIEHVFRWLWPIVVVGVASLFLHGPIASEMADYTGSVMAGHFVAFVFSAVAFVFVSTIPVVGDPVWFDLIGHKFESYVYAERNPNTSAKYDMNEAKLMLQDPKFKKRFKGQQALAFAELNEKSVINEVGSRLLRKAIERAHKKAA